MKRLIQLTLSTIIIYGIGVFMSRHGGSSINTFLLLAILINVLDIGMDIKEIRKLI